MNFNVFEELAELCSLKGTTAGEDLFCEQKISIVKYQKNKRYPWLYDKHLNVILRTSNIKADTNELAGNTYSTSTITLEYLYSFFIQELIFFVQRDCNLQYYILYIF